MAKAKAGGGEAAACAQDAKTHAPGRRALRPVALEPWVASTRLLLAQEQQEEVSAMRDELAVLADGENPNVLSHLQLARCSTGLFGRTLLQLALPPVSLQRAKPHRFTVGDLVQIRLRGATPSSGTKLPTGIVSRVEERAISIAMSSGAGQDDVDEDELRAMGAAITIDRLVNNATFLKLSSALDQLGKLDYGVAQAVVQVVFSGRTPSWNTPLPNITPFNAGLNASQLEAVRFALGSKDLALIHGPPGTGKTTTVVEFILQAVTKFGLKVLVCAPSNIAVDNVLDKLATTSAGVAATRELRFTRIGHPARVLPQILPFCLDAKIARADGTEIVADIRQEMTAMQAKLQRTRDKTARFHLRRELKANRKEIRQREQKVVAGLLKHSDVVFATNVGAASKLLKDVTFDLVVIDEAAQALEASCWIPILKAKRCVLAGDHLQLPPTIKSKAAAAKGLEVTLFDRLTSFPGTQSVVKMLNIQYRMHEDISNWSSRAMYDSALESFEGVAKRKLHELPHVEIDKDDELLNATLLLLDTAGCDLEEDVEDEEDATSRGSGGLLKLSKSNDGEAKVVARHVRALLATGLKQEEVAVITPYNKQVQALKALLLESFPKLEIRSVDGFQGCEKEAVVMSLVRSNAARQVGFLADDRRMNVAITRAKRHVAVVCDTDTISAHKFLDGLVKHFERFGEYRSAQEYLDEDLVEGSVDVAEMQTLSDAASVVAATVEAAVCKAASKPPTASTSKPTQRKSKKPKSTDKTPALSTQNSASDQEVDVSEQQSSRPEENTQVGDVQEKREKAELEEKVEEELEDKPPVQKSVFQLLDSDSDSANGSEEDEPATGGVAEDLETANSLLKDLHLSRLARQPPPAPSAAASSKKSKKKKGKKKKAPGHAAPVDELREDEDELAFLTRQASQSSSCAFQSATRCKKSVTMLGSVCKHCKLKFCYDHAMPELHGCGDAVRAFERAQFQQQMMRPVDAKKLTSDKRKLLKKKLGDKVTEKTAGRSVQAKPKKKKK